jgi:indole-3-glycerol phosphate synthase
MILSGTYLDRIVADVVDRVRERKMRRPQTTLESLPTPPGRASFAAAMRLPGISLIAEVKRASPSKGPIRLDLDVARTVAAYEKAGARAVSVLTEEDHFRGGMVDLEAAVAATALPVLRKDFVVDEYQIEEARAAGASAVLLIAALLPEPRLSELAAYAGAAGLDVLLEVHDRDELERALRQPDAIIGINNRDLRTFEVSLATTEVLAGWVPPDRLLVSESGIRRVADVERLRTWGVDGMLVGESLLRGDDVEVAVRELVGAASAGSGRSTRTDERSGREARKTGAI